MLDPHLLPASSLHTRGPATGVGGEKLQGGAGAAGGGDGCRAARVRMRGALPSGAPMEDAGKPSPERLELWAVVLVPPREGRGCSAGVTSTALGSRPVWAPAPASRFQAVTSGRSQNLKLPLFL